ncbi:alpha/beta hydrolase [Phenylobacterium sp. LjRoot225]|uniref:lipase family protein n=1 Tax=Phenylobacterium sp. LjRoot225 TaxID=3342285 RepID=UPI003ECC1B1C
MSRPTCLRALAALLLLLVAGPALADDPQSGPWSGDGGAPDFYHWTARLPDKPGAMLRQEPLTAAAMTSAGEARRILYSSRSIVADAPIAVSGTIYLPPGPAPAGGWPVAAWAHGTVGVADPCAPSLAGESARNVAYLNRWLSAGFAVVATDYEGLGTPGAHPYMNFRAEARGVLDAVRAALAADPARLSNRVVIVGHSQGSGAAIGAAYLAPEYAAEVHVLGVVATGLVIQMVDPAGAAQLAIPPWENPPYTQAAFDILYFLGLDRSFDPTLSPDDWMTPAAQPALKAALTRCFRDVVAVAKETGLSTATAFRRSLEPIAAREPAHAYLPDARLHVPIFAGIGLADRMAGLEGQYNFVSAACHAGVPVTWRYYPRVGHSGVVNVALADSLPFAKALLAGQVPAGDCAGLKPPGPLQSPDPAIPMND